MGEPFVLVMLIKITSLISQDKIQSIVLHNSSTSVSFQIEHHYLKYTHLLTVFLIGFPCLVLLSMKCVAGRISYETLRSMPGIITAMQALDIIFVVLLFSVMRLYYKVSCSMEDYYVYRQTRVPGGDCTQIMPQFVS